MKKIKTCELSIIIPCYNESKNLFKIFLKLKKLYQKFKSKIYFETILVNNGSKDDSNIIMNELRRKFNLSQVKIINIKKDKGYGYGIKLGLKRAKGNFVSYTHADLQCDIEDCLKIYSNVINSKNSSKIFGMGKRLNRSKFDVFFTNMMSKFCNLILKTKIYDVNAQPKIFKNNVLNLRNAPNDFNLDLYVYYFFKIKNYKILKKNVYFTNRYAGLSKGGGSLKGKIKLSLSILKYIFKLRYGNYYT